MKNYKKILVIGAPGTGKSTVSQEIAQYTNLPLIHLDQLFWTDNWKQVDKNIFDKKLDQILNQDNWIIDGLYLRTLEKRLDKADICIFLDYPEEIYSKRIRDRYEQYKGQTRPDMAENCPEKLDGEFLEFIKEFKDLKRNQIFEILSNSNTKIIVIQDPNQLYEILKEYKLIE